MKQILHPSVRCYADGCHNGLVLVEVDPDAGPIYESCEECDEDRYRQSEQIVADALLHYGTKADLGANRADITWAGTTLGWVERTGRQYRGWIEVAGKMIPATRNQSTFDTFDEAARAVVLAARSYMKIG